MGITATASVMLELSSLKTINWVGLFMRYIKSSFICFVCLMCSVQVHAKIFDFLPFFSKGGAVDVNELLGSKRIMNEPVTVNGISTTLKVAIIDVSLREYSIKLKSTNPKQKVRASQNSLFYSEGQGNGKVVKHYLTQVSAKHPVVHFSMELPEKPPKGISWPKSLPMPASADVESSIVFDERGTAYASFSSMLDVNQAAHEIETSLTGSGWESTSSPASDRQSQTGGFFFKPDERKVLIVSFLATKDGSTSGSIYMKPLKK